RARTSRRRAGDGVTPAPCALDSKRSGLAHGGVPGRGSLERMHEMPGRGRGNRRRARRLALLAAILLAPGVGAWTASRRVPVWIERWMVHPPRRTPPPTTDLPHEDLVLESAGARLVGWRFRAEATRRGIVVYLHGLCDDRREA